MSMQAKAGLLSGIASAAMLLTPTALSQGNLTPPGPPAPSMKTLEQVEARIPLNPARVSGDDAAHFVITQTGSYYLTGNLDVTKTEGVRIAAAGVTLDLNGFSVRRTEGSGGDGIRIDGGAHRCTIKNGSINDFAYGIRTVNTALAGGASFLQLAVSGCSIMGISGGDHANVERCRVFDNAGEGISVGAQSTIRDCIAADNAGGTGITGAARNSISHCTSYNNAGNGISTGGASTISHCTASANKGNVGIFAGASSTVSHCTASGNSAVYGIQVGSGSVVSHSVARGTLDSLPAIYGINAGAESLVIACSATGNASSSSPSSGLSGVGIQVGNRSMVRDCTVAINKGDGIRVDSNSQVIGNNCSHNGDGGEGAGVHVLGNDNRIEANNVVENDRGIHVDAGENLIIKNSAATNAIRNYEIAAGNRYGQIVDGTVPAGAAVSGNGAAATTATTDPWANFAY